MLVPTFFTIFIARVLEIIDLPPCIKTSYGMDTKLFNLACLKSKTKTVLSILELQYADDNSEAALKWGPSVAYFNCLSSSIYMRPHFLLVCLVGAASCSKFFLCNWMQIITSPTVVSQLQIASVYIHMKVNPFCLSKMRPELSINIQGTLQTTS